MLSLDISSLPLPSLESLDPRTLKIVLIGGLLFLLLVLFAFTRHHLISLSLHGLGAGLVIGAILVLGLEAGAYYLYTNYIVGEKAADLPQNFKVVLEDSTKSLEPVLGMATEKKPSTAKEVLTNYNSLDKKDSEALKQIICK